MKRYIKIVIVTLFVLIVQATRQTVFCQRSSVEIMGIAEVNVSNRWNGVVEVSGALDKHYVFSQWGKLAVGAMFKLYEGIVVFGGGGLSMANYNGMDNQEYIMMLKEGVIIYTKSKFQHQLFVDQRRLTFRPTDISVNCSRFGYNVIYPYRCKGDKWFVSPHATVLINVKSEVASSDILQRIKLGGVVQRRIGKSLFVGMRYTYMFGGKEQTYMGEGHNMHVISLFVSRKAPQEKE